MNLERVEDAGLYDTYTKQLQTDTSNSHPEEKKDIKKAGGEVRKWIERCGQEEAGERVHVWSTMFLSLCMKCRMGMLAVTVEVKVTERNMGMKLLCY